MPLSYEIDAEARLVVLACGNTSLERWRDVMMAVFADARYQPGFSVFVDCRSATLAPSTNEVQGVIGFIRSHRAMLGQGRWAVIVEQPAGYGMARMAEAIAGVSSIELRAFRTPDEAHAWLARVPAPESA